MKRPLIFLIAAITLSEAKPYHEPFHPEPSVQIEMQKIVEAKEAGEAENILKKIQEINTKHRAKDNNELLHFENVIFPEDEIPEQILKRKITRHQTVVVPGPYGLQYDDNTNELATRKSDYPYQLLLNPFYFQQPSYKQQYVPLIHPLQYFYNAITSMEEYSPTTENIREAKLLDEDRKTKVESDSNKGNFKAPAWLNKLTGSTTTKKPPKKDDDSSEEDEIENINMDKGFLTRTENRDQPRNNSGSGIFIHRLKVRKGGVAIAGPGGIATAGSGGTAIVGPHGYAFTHPDSLAIAGTGTKVVAVDPAINLRDLVNNKYNETRLDGSSPRVGRIVATGPVIYYNKG